VTAGDRTIRTDDIKERETELQVRNGSQLLIHHFGAMRVKTPAFIL